MSPAWLIHNLDDAYRVALAWGSIWFSLAAIPAYVLARRVGVSAAGSLLVALFALLVPDAVYATNLLTEPFAYPAFLTTVAVAVETLAAPSRRRQNVLLVLMVALCLLRFEFVVFPVAYLIAALGYARWSPRLVVRTQPIVVGGVVLAAISGVAVGLHRIVGYYTTGGSAYHLHASLLRWVAIDLFVLLVAAGWVVVPGACVGFARLLRAGSRQRAFAFLALALVASLLAVGAPYGPAQGRAYERYFFYAAPLVALACVWAAENLGRTRVYAVLSYLVAAAAVLAPLAAAIHDASDDMSPTLLGLNHVGGGGNAASLVWALALAAAAIVTGLRVGGRMVTPLLGLTIIAVIGAVGTHSLLTFSSTLGKRLNVSSDVPRLHAPTGTAILTSSVTNRWLLMKTLFWNPQVDRVLVVGKGPAVDGFAATNVRLVPGVGLVDNHGNRVSGPFAVDTDTVAAPESTLRQSTITPGVLPRAPAVLVFGWNRTDRYLEVVSWFYATAGRRPLNVALTMSSSHGAKAMSIDCGRNREVVSVGFAPRTVRLDVPTKTELACRISLVKGSVVPYRNRDVSVRARLTVRAASTRS